MLKGSKKWKGMLRWGKLVAILSEWEYDPWVKPRGRKEERGREAQGYLSRGRASWEEGRGGVNRRQSTLACLCTAERSAGIQQRHWWARKVERKATLKPTVMDIIGFLTRGTQENHSHDSVAHTGQAGNVMITGSIATGVPASSEWGSPYSLSFQTSPKERASLMWPELLLFNGSQKPGFLCKASWSIF